jgi:hypothetical protein
VNRIVQIIQQLAAAETDREREALRGQLAAEIRALSDDQLRDALTAIRARGGELATEDATEAVVAEIELLRDQARAINSALTERSEGASLADRQRAALADLDGGQDGDRDATHHDPAADQVQPGGEAAPVPDPANQGGGEGNQPTAQQTDTEGGEHERPEGQQAAGRRLGGLNRDGDQRQEAAYGGQVRVVTRLQGGIPGFEVGQNPADRRQLAQAFAERYATIARSNGPAEKIHVARLSYEYPEDRRLTARDALLNTQRIELATQPNSLTAAAQSGGLCLPLEVIYDINVVGVTNRPVRDALTRFQVERGGIQYRLPFDALQMTTGLGIWGQDNDQSVMVANDGTVTFETGNDGQGNAFGPKTCLVVDCPGVVEASIYSTYMCLEFANMTARFDTEWVDATNQAAQVAWARFAENQLLSRLLAASKITYGKQALGSVRDMLATYDKVISYYRNRHRLDTTVPLHTILPQWLIDMLRTDMARAMNTTGDPSYQFGIAQAALESWFRTRNVNVTWHLDGLAATAAAVNGVEVPQQFYNTLSAGQQVPGWPNAVDSLLYREGDWLFLDGGTLDLGLVRDSALNMRNRYQTFTETFEGVAFNGLESLRVVLPLMPNGSSSGTVAPVTDGSWDGMTAYTTSGG